MADHGYQRLIHIQFVADSPGIRIQDLLNRKTDLSVLDVEVGEGIRICQPCKGEGPAFAPFARRRQFLLSRVDRYNPPFKLHHPGHPDGLSRIFLRGGGLDERLQAPFPGLFRLHDGNQGKDAGFLPQLVCD